MLGRARAGTRALAMGAWSATVTQAGVMRFSRLPEPERTSVRERWVQLWASGLLRVFGVKLQRAGEPIAPRGERGRLVVACHRSPLDILLMLHVFGGSVLGRHDLARWPVLGRAARHGATIFVDRQDARSGMKAIREMRRRLGDKRTVIVFPEGTTHRGDEVRPFQEGAFSAARGLDVDVVPVGIAYEPGVEFVDESFAQHLLRVAQRPSTRVAVRVGPALSAIEDRKGIATRAAASVQALVHEARRDVESS